MLFITFCNKFILPTLYLPSIHLCPIHTNYLQCSIFSNKVSLHTQCSALSYHSVYIIFLDRKAVGLNSWLNALRKHWLDTNNTWEKDVKLHPDIFEWKVTSVLSLLDGFSQKCHDLGLLVKQTYKRINEYVITSNIMQHWRDQNDGENIPLCTLDIFMKT